MRRALAVGLFVVVVVVPSCGGDDGGSGDAVGTTTTSQPSASPTVTTQPGSNTPSNVDACGLLSEEEASALIGVAVVGEAPNDAVGSYGVCEWAPAGQGFYTVRLTVGPASLYETLKGSKATALNGLGDEAWSYAYQSAGDPQLDIGVLAGDYNVLAFGEFDLAKGQQFMQAVLDALNA